MAISLYSALQGVNTKGIGINNIPRSSIYNAPSSFEGLFSFVSRETLGTDGF